MDFNKNEFVAQAKAYEQRLPPFPEHGCVPAGRLAQWIDHTLLKPEATPDQVKTLCKDARQYQFASVCINPIYVKLSASLLADSGVKVCTVVGFPLGAVPTLTKVFETRQAIRQGAHEIDMVIPVGLLKGGQIQKVYDGIRAVVDEAHDKGQIVKVILEMALLTRYEKIMGCLLTQAAGAEFVKTSTGFGPGGATQADVELMRRVVGPVEKMGVKAAGGIRTLADAMMMLEVGATRLGSSAGVRLVQESTALS
jgi:deoxyribose-phosphate aldolase